MSINTTDLLYKAVLRGKTGLARPRANSYAAKLATSVALFAVVAFCGPAEAGFFEDLFGGGTQTPIAGPMHTSRPQASRRVDHVRRVEHVWRAAARPATSAAELKPAPVTLTKATWAAYKAPAAARPLFFSKDAQPRRPLFLLEGRQFVQGRRSHPSPDAGSDPATWRRGRYRRGRARFRRAKGLAPTPFPSFGRLLKRAPGPRRPHDPGRDRARPEDQEYRSRRPADRGDRCSEQLPSMRGRRRPLRRGMIDQDVNPLWVGEEAASTPSALAETRVIAQATPVAVSTPEPAPFPPFLSIQSRA